MTPEMLLMQLVTTTIRSAMRLLELRMQREQQGRAVTWDDVQAIVDENKELKEEFKRGVRQRDLFEEE